VGYTAVNILPALAELAQLPSLMLKANADVMVLGPGTLAGVSKVLSLDIRELLFINADCLLDIAELGALCFLSQRGLQWKESAVQLGML